MIRFENYQLVRTQNYLKLSAEALVCFDRIGEEDYALGIPKCWDLEFLKKIDVNQFDLYLIYAKTIPHGQYNRFTDYKKVWGLSHLEKGEYDNSYENEKGRVYVGIKKARGSESFIKGTSSIVLLIPTGKEINCDTILNCLKNSQFNFELEQDQDVLSAIHQAVSGSMVLRYSICERASMSICGRNVESFFNEDDIQRWDAKEQKVLLKGQ